MNLIQQIQAGLVFHSGNWNNISSNQVKKIAHDRSLECRVCHRHQPFSSDAFQETIWEPSHEKGLKKTCMV
jgi:hypothetical protein